jgi:hypothetical protein
MAGMEDAEDAGKAAANSSGAGPQRGRSLASLSAPQTILVLLAVSLVGAIVDLIAFGAPEKIFAVSFVTGSVLAAVLAGRSALFVAGAQPPLAFVGFGVGFSLVLRESSGQGLLTGVAVDTALWMTTWFPVLAAATVPAVLITLGKAWWWREYSAEPRGGASRGHSGGPGMKSSEGPGSESSRGLRTESGKGSQTGTGGPSESDVSRADRSSTYPTAVRSRPTSSAPRRGATGAAVRRSGSPQQP